MTSSPSPAYASPARMYLALSGAFLLVVAVVGFALDTSFPLTASAVTTGHAHVFGVFETNGWHSTGALSLALPAAAVAVARPVLSGAAALAVGLANAVVFLAFAVWDPALFLFASNAADQVMHIALAAGGIGTGTWALLGERARPASDPAGRPA